jgi:DHA2 family multidrug resistance protein-like MFS transporter
MFGVTLTGANMLFITQHLQNIEQLSPLHAGLWMVPAVLTSIAGMLLAPVLARRIRPAYLIAPGLLVSACGGLLLASVSDVPSLLPLVVGFALFNLGAAPLVSLATGLVVGSVVADKAGSAGALVETSGELAFALGIALLGSLGAALTRAAAANGASTNTAFVSGMHVVALVTVGIFLVVAAVEVAFMRRVPPLGAHASPDVEAVPGEASGTPRAVYAA